MGAPGFWDDQGRAAAVSARARRARTGASRASGARVRRGRPRRARRDGAEDDELATELERQLAAIESRLAELEEARLFSGEYDAGDAVVTVRSGAGGTDSQDWAEMLLRMYLRWAERRGFEVEMAEASPGEEAGIKSASFIAKGENAYGLFAAERGVHRLVRISPFDAQSRRHTAFAQVDVAPLVDDQVEVDIDEEDIRVDTYRASGAGGQHVNKTDSAVRITHVPDRDRRPVPERALADAEQGDRDAHAAGAPARGGGAQARRGAGGRARRAEGRRVGLADPQLHPAPLDPGQGPPHRASRSATRAASSTATSTASSAST